ncbi:hypothetical protein MTO96_047389 [Rhipicephalus appendiculatus]
MSSGSCVFIGYIAKRRQLERRRREEQEAAAVYSSGYNNNISTGGNRGHYNHYPALDITSCNENPRGRSTSRDARGGRGKRRSSSRSRTPTPRSTSKTRGGANPGAAAFNQGTQQSQQQHTWRQPQQQGHMGTGQQARWADVAAIPAGGVASADPPLGPAVGGAGGSELEQAIERALEQRLGPLQSMISELKRENAILRAENSKLKGGAARPQQSQQQATMPPPLTPSRPEAAGMDTDDECSSGGRGGRTRGPAVYRKKDCTRSCKTRACTATWPL